MKQLGAVSLFVAAFFFCSVSFVYAADAAPDFTLADLGGKKVSLSSLKGKVVLLNFWATWCAPCRAEMPALNKLYLDLKEKGLVVLAVSVDDAEKTVSAYMKQKKFSFPVLMDADKEVAFDSYGVTGLPTTVLIDRKGLLVETIVGERDWHEPQMKEKILRLLDTK